MPFYQLVCIAAHNKDFVRLATLSLIPFADLLVVPPGPYPVSGAPGGDTCHGPGWCRTRYALLGSEDSAGTYATTQGDP